MKKAAVLISLALCFALPALADEFATLREVETMVAKAVKSIAVNREGTLKEITAKDKKWVDRDLIVCAGVYKR